MNNSSAWTGMNWQRTIPRKEYTLANSTVSVPVFCPKNSVPWSRHGAMSVIYKNSKTENSLVWCQCDESLEAYQVPYWSYAVCRKYYNVSEPHASRQARRNRRRLLCTVGCGVEASCCAKQGIVFWYWRFPLVPVVNRNTNAHESGIPIPVNI
jgi:hypothetical protein